MKYVCFTLGFLGSVIGGLYFFTSATAASECSNALIGAFNPAQCAHVSELHNGALIGMLVGIALVVASFFIKDHPSPVMIPPPPQIPASNLEERSGDPIDS